ncbi:hypothetical protein [Noviherbaspirillum galbum]|uniref:Uncharacterized protein n=1 Tax=Noviherbaspirillum galbum TaxID=2709383 RepID=A0A6B3SIP3_9BURK|nr:hypothetical protein [Noviherbaspirillum galbum]NEX60724.1 hypothetical protein [Noviherbaspirillum galbum]
MDLKEAESAVAWVRTVANKNNGELPDYSTYTDQVKKYLNDPYNMPFKLPKEYQYAYLRVKGMSHADAFERMGLKPIAAAGKSEQKSAWWKFWE